MIFFRFIFSAFVVFSMMAFANVLMLTPAAAEHDVSVPYWLVVQDWDDAGNPIMLQEPEPFVTFAECEALGTWTAELLVMFEPDRNFVSVCIHPEDGLSLDDIIDIVIDDWNEFFQPPGQAV